MSIGAFVRERRDEILVDWGVQAGIVAASLGRGGPALARMMPHLIEDFARVLDGKRGPAESFANDCAAEVLESAAPLSQLVQELGLFRRCVLRSWRKEHPAGLHAEAAAAAAEMDAVVERTIDRYLDMRTNLLDAFERIAVSALTASDLDGFLRELLTIFASLAPSVDSLAILLREGTQLTLRASLGPLPAAAAGLAIPLDEGFAGSGCDGVPLLDNEEVVGVALARSTAGIDIPVPEKRLFALVAQRAATAIVSHRLRADATKKAAELDAFIEAIPSPVYLGTADGFTSANRAGLDLLDVVSTDELRRLSPAELVARIQLRVPATDAPAPDPEERLFERALRGERISVDLCAQTLRAGELRFYQCIAGPVIIDGRPEGAVFVMSDITEIKRAEDRFRMMFEQIPMAIAQSDPRTGKLVRVNARMCELTGYAAEELVGHSFMEWTHPDDRAANMEQYRRMVRGEVDVYTTEKRYLRKDGSVVWVRVTARKLLPRAGEPAHTLATIEDVTARRNAEREREDLRARESAAAEELRRAAEFRERFLGIVSHDLRNPISTILLTIQNLTHTNARLPDDIATSLGRVTSAANRMHRIIAELLDLTRGRLGGGIPIEPKKTDLGPVVRRVVDELALAYPSRRLVLEANGTFEGDFDAARVEQLASNLIGNALQHSPPDAVVAVSLVNRCDAGVVLEVRNGGAAIRPDLLPHLFEPFRQGSKARGASSGLGLGLFIVAEVVRAHGGTIQVASTAADGTTFTVALPRTSIVHAS